MPGEGLVGGTAGAIQGMQGAIDTIQHPTLLDPRWQGVFRAGASQAPNANPYNAGMGAQTIPAQQALFQQMQATAQQPSVSGMLGQQAQGQMLRQALAASPGAGRPVAAQAAVGQQQLANQTGLQRLQEQMAASQNQGALAGQMRQGGLQNAAQQVQAGLQQRQTDDAATRFYASQGSNYALAQQMQDAKNKALMQAYLNMAQNGSLNALQGGLSLFASMFGGK